MGKYLRTVKSFFLRPGLIDERPKPVSRVFGFDRGKPIDRFYIEAFLQANKDAIQGTVVEVGDNQYTKLFHSSLVQESLVIGNVGHEANSDLLRSVDLESGTGLQKNIADCLILTQVLPFIFDLSSAVANISRLLRPGGKVLSTMGGISQISRYDMDRWGDYWRFTDASAKRLFSDVFGPSNVAVSTYGNVATAKAFLDGLCAEELPQKLLSEHDPDYQVTVCVRAEKR
jgi:hypothetical protein